MAIERKFALKNDQYRAARGGWARFLNLYCAICQAHLLLYQKDGSGTLYRLYLDRIFAPYSFAQLQDIADLSAILDLVCPTCKAVIGTPTVWEEENRKAFQLNQDSFTKRVGKGVYTPK